MTLRHRLRRAWLAFRDYPGKRFVNGDEAGVLVRCGEPWGCGGSGVMHQPDVLPLAYAPEEGPLREVRVGDLPYCHMSECLAVLPDEGEVVGWTIWRNEAERTLLLCPGCTEWSREQAR